MVPAVDVPPVPPPLSFYELVVIDEREAGVAGLRVELDTPAGLQTLVTDDAGAVRVDQVPAGSATGRIVSGADEMAAALAAAADQPKRRTPLPEPDARLVVLTPSGAAQAVTFPDAVTQRVMLVARTDLVWSSVVPQWGDLTLLTDESVPAALVSDAVAAVLSLASTGGAPRAIVGVPASGVDVAASAPGAVSAGPSGARKTTLAIDVDALHDALFALDFDAARALLDPATAEPPPPPDPPPFPTPSAEAGEFAAELALQAVQGHFDLLTFPEEQV